MATDNAQGQVKEISSTPNHLSLVEFKPDYYGGINADMNFLFFLDKAPIVGFVGDQGQGKTSLLNCLIELLGGEAPANAENVTYEVKEPVDGEEPKKKATRRKKTEITIKDQKNENIHYLVTITKTAYSIKMVDTANDVTSAISQPKEFIRKLIGPLGLNPMVLKEKDGKKQIEWLRSMYRFTPAQLAEEKDLIQQYKDKFKARTTVNNDVKRLYDEVKSSPYYKWDSENSCFGYTQKRTDDQEDVRVNSLDEDAINSEFTTADGRNRELESAKTKLETQKTNKATIEDEIIELQRKLEAKKQELIKTEENITVAEAYIAEREDAPAKLEEVKKKMMRSGELKVMKNNLGNADMKVKEYDAKVDEQIHLNSDLDDLKIQKKNFVKQFTPDIEGLEIIVHDSIDNDDLEEGMYYKERAMSELSESELWDFNMQLARKLGMRFMFIENLQSLGTDAIERINWFVSEGYGQVFYTAMQRGKKIEVTFHTQLE